MTLEQPMNSLLLFSSTSKPPFLMKAEKVSPIRRAGKKNPQKTVERFRTNPPHSKKRKKQKAQAGKR